MLLADATPISHFHSADEIFSDSAGRANQKDFAWLDRNVISE